MPQKQPSIPADISLPYLILKGLATVLIVLAIVAPLMLIVIGGLFLAFGSEAASEFIGDHTYLVASLIVVAVITSTITIINVIASRQRKSAAKLT